MCQCIISEAIHFHVLSRVRVALDSKRLIRISENKSVLVKCLIFGSFIPLPTFLNVEDIEVKMLEVQTAQSKAVVRTICDTANYNREISFRNVIIK